MSAHDVARHVWNALASARKAYSLSSYRRAHGAGNEVEVRLWHGLRMSLRYDDHVAQRVLTEWRFEPEVSAVSLAVIRRGMTVVDVGANIGVHTLLFAQLVGPEGHVVALEPNPVALRQLRRNITLNALTNVTVVGVAASDEEGEADFSLPVDGQEAFGGLSNSGRFAEGARTRVATDRLDRILPELGFAPASLLKIDVEGSELRVIRGARSLLEQSPRPTVIYEADYRNLEASSCTEQDTKGFLEERGYTVYEISPQERLAIPD